jgi:glutaminase
MAVAVVPSRTPWPAETGPVESPIQAYLEELHARFIDDRSGELATYIPQLGLADSDWFGICLATTDGRVYEVGDTRVPFTIQSMSKPFTYGLALQDQGADAVAAKLDVEPSGDAFNSISLTPGTGRPRNPMINAGAITATSLVPERARNIASSGFSVRTRAMPDVGWRLMRTYSAPSARAVTATVRSATCCAVLRSLAMILTEPSSCISVNAQSL